MRVLLANDEEGMRGGELQTISLAEGLMRQGCEVIIAARKGSALAGRASAGFPCETFPFESAPLVTPYLLSRLIRRRGPDVLHAQTSGAHTHLWLARGMLRGAPPLIVSRRVAFPVKRNPFSLLKYGSGVARYIPISAASAASLSRVGVPSARMTFIPSGVEVARFRDSRGRRDLVAKWGFEESDSIIGTVGALEVEKGHATLIDAASRVMQVHPEARFLIMGTGSLAGKIAGAISSRGLEGRVRCVPQEAPIEEVLPLFLIFVLPSLSEGLSSALIAAMAAGLPLVASDTGGIPEVISPGCGMLVPPGDAGELSRALVRLLDDAELRKRLGEEGSSRAALFDISVTVRRTFELYERVLREDM